MKEGTATDQPRLGMTTRASPELWLQVQEFLHREADLLDARCFDEWLTLLDEDIHYWAPLARNLKRKDMADEYTGAGEAAWFDEGFETLRQRVLQLNTGVHWAEEPASRVSHLITNIRILDAKPDYDQPMALTVRSRFLVYMNRLQGEVAWLVGKRVDTLRRHGGDWKIARRAIYLDQSVLQAKALTTFL
jgi:3-phenylpropionate/cinnamic acid dioxygenase small subunit